MLLFNSSTLLTASCRITRSISSLRLQPARSEIVVISSQQLSVKFRLLHLLSSPQWVVRWAWGRGWTTNSGTAFFLADLAYLPRVVSMWLQSTFALLSQARPISSKLSISKFAGMGSFMSRGRKRRYFSSSSSSWSNQSMPCLP